MRSKMFRNYALGTSVVLTVAFFGGRAAAGVPAGQDNDPRAYAAMKTNEMEGPLLSLQKERDAFQKRILDALVEQNPKPVRIAAIYMAGLYRMENTAAKLTEMIDFIDENRIGADALPLWSKYPAVEALRRIGMPAVPPVVRKLATSDNDNVRWLSRNLLQTILGKSLATAAVKEYLDGLRGDSGAAARKRLEAELRLLEQ